MKSLVGCHATHVIAEIAGRSAAIEWIDFVRIPAANPLLQQRLSLSPTETEVVKRALEIREQTALPFWDSTIVSSFGATQTVLQLLEAALRHNPTPGTAARLRAQGCTPDKISTLFPEPHEGNILALLSAVSLHSGEVAHIPMLDFHLPCTKVNERIAMDALHALQPGPGYLLASGKSYHFIGMATIADHALSRFLARALLLSPLVDRSWIAHQLIEGRCALRVSPRPAQDDAPQVVAAYIPDCR